MHPPGLPPLSSLERLVLYSDTDYGEGTFEGARDRSSPQGAVMDGVFGAPSRSRASVLRYEFAVPKRESSQVTVRDRTVISVDQRVWDHGAQRPTVRDHDHAALRVPRGDATHRLHDARFKFLRGLSVSPRPCARLREPLEDLVIRQSLPCTEVAFAKFRKRLDGKAVCSRDELCCTRNARKRQTDGSSNKRAKTSTVTPAGCP